MYARITVSSGAAFARVGKEIWSCTSRSSPTASLYWSAPSSFQITEAFAAISRYCSILSLGTGITKPSTYLLMGSSLWVWFGLFLGARLRHLVPAPLHLFGADLFDHVLEHPLVAERIPETSGTMT